MPKTKALQITYQVNDSRGCKEVFVLTLWNNRMKKEVPFQREGYEEFQFNAIYKNYYSIDDFEEESRSFFNKTNQKLFKKIENVKFGLNAHKTNTSRYKVVGDYEKFQGFHLLQVEKIQKQEGREFAAFLYQLMHLPELPDFIAEEHWQKLGPISFAESHMLPDFYKKYKLIANKKKLNSKNGFLDFEIKSVEVINL